MCWRKKVLKRQGVTKKNFLIILMLCLLSICLMACGDRDYTRKDADKLAKKYSRKFHFVDEQILGERETIWTYYDEKLGWNFTVHEKPFKGGFDGMSWDDRALRTDYDELVRDYILEMDEVKKEGFARYDDYNSDYMHVVAADRADLKDKVKCLQTAINIVSQKTKNDAYRITVYFKLSDTSYSCKLKNSELDEVEGEILLRAFIDYDDTILNQYSERELKQVVKQNAEDEIKFIYPDGRRESTGLLVLSGNTYVTKRAFKHWLETNGYVVTGTYDEYSFTNSRGELITIDYHTNGNGDKLGFHYIKETLGLQDVKVGYER
jgi:hypothetical protein